jgi:hypothetical protein
MVKVNDALVGIPHRKQHDVRLAVVRDPVTVAMELRVVPNTGRYDSAFCLSYNMIPIRLTVAKKHFSAYTAFSFGKP